MRTFSIIALGMLLALTGCASQLRRTTTVAKPSPTEPPVRREEAIKQFDTLRDRAQLEAARAYWRQGEVAKSEAEINLILARSPDQKEANLLVAEIYLATERATDARVVLTKLVEKSPNDARVHHSLGLTAEALADGRAAREHFQTAARLAPDNSAYAADLANWTTILGK